MKVSRLVYKRLRMQRDVRRFVIRDSTPIAEALPAIAVVKGEMPGREQLCVE